tara:strand:- start:3431 stop:5353 length:1923 start_codon:yes stop_codon:yes gene_type:complete
MNFRKDINGLRAIAVIAVVLFHFNANWLPGGFAGVDVFFVISGFLMTGIIFRGLEQDNFSIMRFYVARANRIIPALAFLCVCLSIFGWFYLIPSNYKVLGRDIGSSIGFISNMIFCLEMDYFAPNSKERWLLHTWSLSTEWQFYIIYPLILCVMNKFMSVKTMKSYIFFGAVIGFIGCVYATYTWPRIAYFIFPTRAWEMMLGGIAYLFPWELSNNKKKYIKWIGLGLITISYILISEDNPWPGYLAMLPVIGAYLVIQAHDEYSIFAQNKLLQCIGTWSYSIYLWHWPLVVAIYYFSLNENFIYIGLVLSVICGYISYKYIESIKFKSDFGHPVEYFNCKPIYIVLAIGVLGSSIFLTSGSLWHYPVKIQSLYQDGLSTHMKKGGCNKGAANNIDPNCKNIKAIIIGDSHAATLALSLRNALIQENDLLNFAKPGCFIVKGFSLNGDTMCSEHITSVYKKLDEYIEIPVFIDNRFNLYIDGKNEVHEKENLKITRHIPQTEHIKERSELYKKIMTEAYKNAICDISKKHPTYIMEQTPELKLQVPVEMSKSILIYSKTKQIKITLAEFNQRNQKFYKMAKELEHECNVKLVRTKHLFCDDQFCYGDDQGRPLYFDDDHLNEYGASRITPIFKEIMSHHQ